jgi:uncharacterized OB-fold protein
VTEPLATPFLDAAAQGRLVLQVCAGCANAQLPPRARCERCGRTAFEWQPAAGTGRIATFSVLHRSPDQRPVPYVYAVVELAEGPRVVTNVIGCDPAAVRIGQPVRVSFGPVDEDGRRWPRFEPA